MFKLESYITPILLSHVEKYVKNVKAEQSQVSLTHSFAKYRGLRLIEPPWARSILALFSEAIYTGPLNVAGFY